MFLSDFPYCSLLFSPVFIDRTRKGHDFRHKKKSRSPLNPLKPFSLFNSARFSSYVKEYSEKLSKYYAPLQNLSTFSHINFLPPEVHVFLLQIVLFHNIRTVSFYYFFIRFFRKTASPAHSRIILYNFVEKTIAICMFLTIRFPFFTILHVKAVKPV